MNAIGPVGDEPVGLDPQEDAVEQIMRTALRLLALSLTGQADGSCAVRVMTQSWSREAPRSVLLYETTGPLGTVEEMVQALHTAAEELRLRYREEHAIL